MPDKEVVLDLGQKLTALFQAIDARFAVGDDYRVEFGIWVWPDEAVPITYWTKLKQIDLHDPCNPKILIDLSSSATETIDEAVDLLLQAWHKLLQDERAA